MATHTLGINFTLKLRVESLSLMSVNYAWSLPKANSTAVRNLYRLLAACPCLSWSTIAMCTLTWVVFVPGVFTAMLRSGSSPSLALTADCAQHYSRTFKLLEIFKWAHLKFTVFGRKQATYTVARSNCHACFNFSHLHSRSSMLHSGNSPSPTRLPNAWVRGLRTLKFNHAHLKFMVYGRKQASMCAMQSRSPQLACYSLGRTWASPTLVIPTLDFSLYIHYIHTRGMWNIVGRAWASNALQHWLLCC